MMNNENQIASGVDKMNIKNDPNAEMKESPTGDRARRRTKLDSEESKEDKAEP